MDGFLRRSRAALLWSLLFLGMVFLGGVVVLDRYGYGWIDPEYGRRIQLLRERLREAPTRPLLLVMGSSRTVMSFRPEMLAEMFTPDGRAALAFNFSHTSAGPIMNLVGYHRLRREGVRPDWLVMEVLPPALVGEHPQLLRDGMTAADYPVLRRYLNPSYLTYRYAGSRLAALYHYRNRILECVAPDWADPQDHLAAPSEQMGPLGGDRMVTRDAVTPEAARKALAVAQEQYKQKLQHFTVNPADDRAVREVLDLCRQDGVRVVLLLTPEGTEFRKWYTADTERKLKEWSQAVSRDYDVPVLDARCWLADDDFLDAHHVLTRGAMAFTRRLETEVLRPLVEGRLNGSGYSTSVPKSAAGRGNPAPTDGIRQ